MKRDIASEGRVSNFVQNLRNRRALLGWRFSFSYIEKTHGGKPKYMFFLSQDELIFTVFPAWIRLGGISVISPIVSLANSMLTIGELPHEMHQL
jgi:hypothetical protein